MVWCAVTKHLCDRTYLLTWLLAHGMMALYCWRNRERAPMRHHLTPCAVLQSHHCTALPDNLELYPNNCANPYKGAVTATGAPPQSAKSGGVGTAVHLDTASQDPTFGTEVRARLSNARHAQQFIVRPGGLCSRVCQPADICTCSCACLLLWFGVLIAAVAALRCLPEHTAPAWFGRIQRRLAAQQLAGRRQGAVACRTTATHASGRQAM
jgi:hypothetical protein